MGSSHTASMRQNKIDLQQTTLPGEHRFGLYFAIFVLLGLSIFIGRAIGMGDLTKAAMVVSLLFGTGIGLWMGEKVWLIVPFVFCFNVGAIPVAGRVIELPELGMVAMTGIALVRFAARKQKLNVMSMENLGLLLYMGWVIVVYITHPVGLAAAGSTDVGGRFYIKLLLAFMAFAIVANQRVTEWDAKWIVRMWIIGAFATMGWDIYSFFKFQNTLSNAGVATEADSFYSWHQAMGRPAVALMFWMLAKYSLAEVFGWARPYLPVLMAACCSVGLLSGKRAGFAALVAAPFLSGLIRREFRWVIGMGVGAVLILAVLVGGHGTAFSLPKTAQRALAVLPGSWDADVVGQFGGADGGTSDLFRQRMRELAWDKIEKNPYVGTGFGIDTNQFLRIVYSSPDTSTQQIAALAMGSSWHNMWLAAWADFGVPAVIFWGIYVIQSIVYSWKGAKCSPNRGYCHMVALMCFFTFARELSVSWFGGHAALAPFNQWWMYGLVLAIVRTRREEAAPNGKASKRGVERHRAALAEG